MNKSISIKKIILIIIALIIIGTVLLLAFSGIFTKIIITEKEAGSFWLVYKRHEGPYHIVKKVMAKIYHSLKTNEQINATKGFGIYYNDPKKTDVEDLRSDVGYILDKKDYKYIPRLKKNFKIKMFAKTKCMVIEFPFRNSFSVYLGIILVYPVLESYIKEKKYKSNPVMEIYDKPNKKILYIAPIR